MEKRGRDDAQTGQCRQSVRKALETEKQSRQAAGTHPSAPPKVACRGLWGQWCPKARVPSMPGASAAPGSSALIRGPANGSEDWPVPGTLLSRDLGEIYS